MARRKQQRLTTSSSRPGLARFVMPSVVVLIFAWRFVAFGFHAGMHQWHALVAPAVEAAAMPGVPWERVPPRPERYVTDLAGVVDADTASRLNETLAKFERDTSNQIVVYVARAVPFGTTMEEVATASFAEWGIGRKGRDNGVLFLVFIDDRQMRIEVGYGLEGVLTDAKAKRITSTVVKPFFKSGDYAGGIEAGARAIMDVIRGEGSGDGRTLAEMASLFGANVKHFSLEALGTLLVSLVLGSFVFLLGIVFTKLEPLYNKMPSFAGGGSSGSWSSSSSSSSSSWSSSSSSSSSSFSGGGGSSGGGGASDSW